MGRTGARLTRPQLQQAEPKGARTQGDGSLRRWPVATGCHLLPGMWINLSYSSSVNCYHPLNVTFLTVQ